MRIKTITLVGSLTLLTSFTSFAMETHTVDIGLKMVNTGSKRAPKSKITVRNDVWIALGRPSNVDFRIKPSPGAIYFSEATLVLSGNENYRWAGKTGGNHLPPVSFYLTNICIDYPAAYVDGVTVCSEGKSIHDGSSSGDFKWETHTLRFHKCIAATEYQGDVTYSSGDVVHVNNLEAYKAIKSSYGKSVHNTEHWEHLGQCD